MPIIILGGSASLEESKQQSQETSEAKEEIANPFPGLPRLINGEARNAVKAQSPNRGVYNRETQS
jgi:hypothetical protein